MKSKKTETTEQGLYDRMKTHLYSKEALFGKDSPFSELLQVMVNKMLEGEIDHFIETETKQGRVNKRNGYTSKKALSSGGTIEILTPRDRNSDFEPELIGKRETQLTSGVDAQILALYAQGNSIEDVKRLLNKIYGIEISAGKISQITDSILPELEQWRNRSLQQFYPIVYLDAIVFKVRHEGKYSQRAFYTTYGVDWEGNRDLLGMYIGHHEGAGQWGMVLEDLKRRGLEDILIICTDDLPGFTNSINEVYPQAITQKCIVHQVRNSLRFVEDKDKRNVSNDLRKIYSSVTVEQAQSQLTLFENQWGKQYSYIVKQWTNNWDELMAFMDFGKDIRRMIYTTNPVEALHRIIRKVIKGKAAWVSETALMKQIYLTLSYNEKSWKRKAYNWTSIQREIIQKYPERVINHQI